MCIFSQSVQHVSSTRIYARIKDDRQFLVYQMHLVSDQDQAMILPLPTKSREEDAVAFIDLSAYPEFFDHLGRCFPHPVSRGPVAASAPLAVHRVGAFEASFVPSRADFARLDPRFRLSDGVWDQLPGYDDFGFAVFQIAAGDHRVHPMALSFPCRDANALFFPTAHVHDEQVHATADYDHRLYTQADIAPEGWGLGKVLPRDAMKQGFFESQAAQDLLCPDIPVVGRGLRGELPNQDTWLLRG